MPPHTTPEPGSASRGDPPPPPSEGPFRASAARLPGGGRARRNVLLLLAAGLLVTGVIVRSLRSAPRSTPMLELARARPARTFVARLSLDTEYRLCRRLPTEGDGIVPREKCETDDDAPLDPQEFAGGSSVDPVSLRAAALAEVIGGGETEASLDTVISRLERALRLSRDQGPLLVDLSGAHLVRAERTQNSRDLVEGLHYAREALAREPRNEAALFNAALALELLAISGEAVKAWDAYLAADSASDWAEEARRRKRALSQPRPVPRNPAPGASAAEVDSFAAHYPQEARLLGWDHVLGDWGAAVLAGDRALAASHLDLAGKLGSALERRHGDASLADAVRAVRAAASDAAATRRLARAHRAYAAAQERYQVRDITAALDSFTRVIRLRPPSPLLLAWATASRGGMQVYEDTVAAEEAFQALLSRVDSVRHPAMTARLRWMQGTLLMRNGHYQEAEGQYQAAAQNFERIGEGEFVGAALGHRGEAMYKKGDTLGGYRLLHQALLTLRPHLHSVERHNTLYMLAYFATLDGMTSANAPIEEEDVAVARHIPVALLPEALLGRAHVLAMTGQADAAARDLNAAAPLVNRLKPGIAHNTMAARLRFVRTVLESRTSNPPSIAALDSAIDYFSNEVIWLLPALLQRADVRLASRDVAGAAADLDAATVRIRGLSRQVNDAVLRAAMIDEARSRFDQLVMLHVNAGEPREALEALERGRISFAPGHDAPSTADRSDPVAPPGEVALEYALIGDTLLSWTVRGRDVSLLRHTVNRGELVRAVERVGTMLESSSPTDSVLPDLARLYDWLVRPVKDSLGAPETPLVILADGEVAGVPFEALFDRGQKRYLLDDHPLRFAASLADANRPAPRAARPGPVLLVANPAFDPHQHPTLDPLPGAHAEVSSLQAIYPGAVPLEGHDATREAFATQAQRASMIHYAGHAVFDDARPERSYLVLAGDGTSGQLTTAAVDSLDLSGVRVIVLSACRTLRSREGRSGGFAGLSGALLGAGAGGVVGSLWNVADGRTQPLMLEFHREYRHSGDPARALRTAQLRILHPSGPVAPAPRSPAAWAGFRYVGAAAPPPNGGRLKGFSSPAP